MQNWSIYNSVEGCLPSISEVLCLFTRTEKKDLNAEHKSTSKLEESLVSWVWRLTPTNQHPCGKGRGITWQVESVWATKQVLLSKKKTKKNERTSFTNNQQNIKQVGAFSTNQICRPDMGMHAVNPARRRQRQANLYRFEVGKVYTPSSRTVRVIQRDNK